MFAYLINLDKIAKSIGRGYTILEMKIGLKIDGFQIISLMLAV